MEEFEFAVNRESALRVTYRNINAEYTRKSTNRHDGQILKSTPVHQEINKDINIYLCIIDIIVESFLLQDSYAHS